MPNWTKILLLGLLTSTLTTPAAMAASKEYPDVTEGSQYYKAISVFTADEILEGYPDGTFKPEQPINRAEALKVILKAFNKDDSELPTENFSDVDPIDWFYKFVIQGVKHNIIQGYEDGTFKPGNQVLFSESLKMAMQAKGIDMEPIIYSEFHPSVSSTDWFAKYFSYGYEKNYFNLEKNGGLNPIRALNRGEFMDLVYRVKSTGTDGNFDISYNWNEETNDKGLNVSIPFEWTYYTLGDGVFLGYFAGQNPTFIKNVPNGARISINYLQNSDKIPANDYFASIKADTQRDYNSLQIDFAEKTTSYGQALSLLIKEKGIFDYYVYLKDQTILKAEGSFDESSLKATDLLKEMQKIYDKINYEGYLSLTADQKLEVARRNIKVLGKGKETLNLFIEKELFYTDALGLGTGPVDYYYINGVNQTIKYERNSDIIVDMQEGKTSSF